ncbi:YmfQ family protein [Alkaliphilus sp. MSJ-5]|uniref:YmfQ family protein n=1 Tax=Alkaliphilus flagellatus TaxID=2841507 RepID=A0ABS6G5V6_9FIRM|nr:putative phage tail protein [Alkaliphilus flagellatus]MBU5676756.1 YmfQ family protein [Alkaliphilus flagellatus]
MIQREIDIASYLPKIIKEIKEFQEISKAENPEISLIWNNIQNIFDDQFVNIATVNGIKRWEKILKIVPKVNHTLEDRASIIVTRLNEQLPYTYGILKQLLNQLCGTDGYDLNINYNQYEVSIFAGLKSKNRLREITDLTKKVLPANINIIIGLKINSDFKLNTYIQKYEVPYSICGTFLCGTKPYIQTSGTYFSTQLNINTNKTNTSQRYFMTGTFKSKEAKL